MAIQDWIPSRLIGTFQKVFKIGEKGSQVSLIEKNGELFGRNSGESRRSILNEPSDTHIPQKFFGRYTGVGSGALCRGKNLLIDDNDYESNDGLTLISSCALDISGYSFVALQEEDGGTYYLRMAIYDVAGTRMWNDSVSVSSTAVDYIDTVLLDTGQVLVVYGGTDAFDVVYWELVTPGFSSTGINKWTPNTFDPGIYSQGTFNAAGTGDTNVANVSLTALEGGKAVMVFTHSTPSSTTTLAGTLFEDGVWSDYTEIKAFIGNSLSVYSSSCTTVDGNIAVVYQDIDDSYKGMLVVLNDSLETLKETTFFTGDDDASDDITEYMMHLKIATFRSGILGVVYETYYWDDTAAESFNYVSMYFAYFTQEGDPYNVLSTTNTVNLASYLTLGRGNTFPNPYLCCNLSLTLTSKDEMLVFYYGDTAGNGHGKGYGITVDDTGSAGKDTIRILAESECDVAAQGTTINFPSVTTMKNGDMFLYFVSKDNSDSLAAYRVMYQKDSALFDSMTIVDSNSTYYLDLTYPARVYWVDATVQTDNALVMYLPNPLTCDGAELTLIVTADNGVTNTSFFLGIHEDINTENRMCTRSGAMRPTASVTREPLNFKSINGNWILMNGEDNSKWTFYS